MANFYQEVIKKSACFDSAQRVCSLDLLQPTFRRKVEAILAEAHARRIPMGVFETYRSPRRQHQLFLEGAAPRNAVDVHHFGLAADLVFIHGGEPSWRGDFSVLGQLARAHALIWGGDWGACHVVSHAFFDDDHVQWCSLGRQAALYRGDWYPDDHYDPYYDL